MYAAAAAAAVAAISSIASGMSSASQARRNADAMMNSALANANTATAVTEYNNKLRLFNGRLSALAASASASATMAIADYNSSLLLMAADYNANLVEEEQKLIYSALDLDIMQFRKSAAQYQGEYIASVGASGVSVGFGSNKEVLLAMKAEEELNVMIMRHNADIKWAELENAKRQGLWQAEVKAQQIQYEGRLNAATTMLQGMLSLASSAASSVVASQQNILNTTANIYNAGVGAVNTYNQGQVDFTASMFQAASYTTSAYSAYRTDSLINQHVTEQKINTQLDSEVFSNPSLY